MASIKYYLQCSWLHWCLSELTILLCFLPLGRGLLDSSIYALNTPIDGCQDNWYEILVQVRFESIITKTGLSDILSARIYLRNADVIELAFCIWNGTENTEPYDDLQYEDVEGSRETEDYVYFYEALFNFAERKPGYLHSWPPGRYCIYNVGKLEISNDSISWDYGQCPDGFEAGTSSYPFGAYIGGYGATRYSPLGPFITHSNNTSIEFCCSSEPDPRAISLPFVKPFYLLPYDNKECQPVKDTYVRLEYIQWPELTYEGGRHPYFEENPAKNGTLVYMCYYIPNANRLVISLTYIITLGSVVLSLTFFFLMGWCHRKKLEWNHNRMLSLQYSGYNKDDSV